SLDARKGTPVCVLRVRVWIDEPFRAEPAPPPALRDVRGAPPAVVVGAGPAGLFAALTLVGRGLRPSALEPGPGVRGRRQAGSRAREGRGDRRGHRRGRPCRGTGRDPRDRAFGPRRAHAPPTPRPRTRGEAVRGRRPRRASPGAGRPDPVSLHDSTARGAGGV